jgi:hypothetical protein
MTRIKRTRPSPPLGPYPQLVLWGHAGSTPMSNKTKITINTVDIAAILSTILFGAMPHSEAAPYGTTRSHSIEIHDSMTVRQSQ